MSAAVLISTLVNGSRMQNKYSTVRSVRDVPINSYEAKKKIRSYRNRRDGQHLYVRGYITRFRPPPCPGTKAQDEIADANHCVACPDKNKRRPEEANDPIKRTAGILFDVGEGIRLWGEIIGKRK